MAADVERAAGRSDVELIDQIRANGPERASAWNELLERYTPKMFGVARSFAVDKATAEDLVQTAWLRFLERSDQLREASAVGPWLCMIVRNEARRLVTRQRTIPVADGWSADLPTSARRWPASSRTSRRRRSAVPSPDSAKIAGTSCG